VEERAEPGRHLGGQSAWLWVVSSRRGLLHVNVVVSSSSIIVNLLSKRSRGGSRRCPDRDSTSGVQMQTGKYRCCGFAFNLRNSATGHNFEGVDLIWSYQYNGYESEF